MPERMMVTCPGCDGVVSVTRTGDEAEVRCLKCDEVVYARNDQGGEWWANVPVADPTVEKPVVVPVAAERIEVPATTRKAEWMLPAGWAALILGVVAFIASYNVGPRQGVDARLLQALMNPLFFVGVPLGLYWIKRSQNPVSRLMASGKLAIRHGTQNLSCGTTSVAASHFDHAITKFTAVIQIEPGNAEAYLNRGFAYLERRALGAAIEDCTKAIRLNPVSAAAYNTRGVAYIHKGDLDTAIEDLTEAIRLNPNYGLAYENRGIAHQKNNAPALASRDFSKAREFK